MKTRNVNIRDINSIVHERKLIREHILPIVKEIRSELAKTYKVDDGDYNNYNGLCFEATAKFIEKMKTKVESNEIPLEITVRQIHGEQAHHPRIPSQYWPIQHTWAAVDIKGGSTIYVDITSQQFKFMYDNIPDFYISVSKPEWYYPDNENPAWRGLTHKINSRVKIPIIVKGPGCNSGFRKVHEGIVEFCQYSIWGFISDNIIRKFFGYK